MKSWKRNFLEPSGQLQGCNGTALPLPGGSSTAHIYTQTIHRTTQLTTLVGRLSGIRTQSGQTKSNDELRKNYRLMGRVYLLFMLAAIINK